MGSYTIYAKRKIGPHEREHRKKEAQGKWTLSKRGDQRQQTGRNSEERYKSNLREKAGPETEEIGSW